ncbi:MAG: SpoIIE family protein phosphatase [Spirochaetia bacterium]|nr:SpoIIE family protein phosphatase [Spirochaetia bacterium]
MSENNKYENIERELKKAREIQKLLLPQGMPNIDGAKLAFKYEPAHDLGGDFLDFYYKKSEEQLGFFICDVSGHGVPAALLAVMVKMSLQLWGEHISDPVGTLKKIHRSLHGKMGEHFLTAIIGFLCLKTGALKIARAGHPPVILINKDGEFSRINSEGTIIHEQIEIFLIEYAGRLHQNETLVLFTDGLTEAVSPDGKMLEEKGLINMLEKHKYKNPDEICNNVLTETFEFAGGKNNLKDDLSLFIIKYTKEKN